MSPRSPGKAPSGCDTAPISGGCRPAYAGDLSSGLPPPPKPPCPTMPGAEVEERSELPAAATPCAAPPCALARAARDSRPSSDMICAQAFALIPWMRSEVYEERGPGSSARAPTTDTPAWPQICGAGVMVCCLFEGAVWVYHGHSSITELPHDIAHAQEEYLRRTWRLWCDASAW